MREARKPRPPRSCSSRTKSWTRTPNGRAPISPEPTAPDPSAILRRRRWSAMTQAGAWSGPEHRRARRRATRRAARQLATADRWVHRTLRDEVSLEAEDRQLEQVPGQRGQPEREGELERHEERR